MMPEVTLTIGGRAFTVACQPGEEDQLQQAASLLDVEASAIQTSAGRVPESRMLLMAGLMLADKAAEMARAAETAENRSRRLEEELRRAEQTGQAEAQRAVDTEARAALEDVANRVEALADRLGRA